MSFFFFIFISFLCPFVSAQVSNDYIQEAFSGYFDVLINFIVPFVIILFYGSKSIAQLVRGLFCFAIIGVQQELAFTFSSVKVSNFIKILQHIVVGLFGIEIIGEVILMFSKPKETKTNPSNDTLKKLEKSEEKIIQTFEEKIKKNLKQYLEDKLEKYLLKSVYSVYEEKVNTLEERVKTLEQSSSNKKEIAKEEPAEPVTQMSEPHSNVTSTHAGRFVDPFVDSKKEKKEKKEITIENPFPKITLSSPSGSGLLELEPYLANLTDLEYLEREDIGIIERTAIEEKQKKRFVPRTHIRTLFLLDYTALTLFIILLGFLLNDLKENITQSFVITLVITVSLTFIVQFTILIIAYRRKNLKVYIYKHQQIYREIFPKYHAHLIIICHLITPHMLYLPSLINCFLLQTPDIFNKIFLNLSALLVSTWIVLMYNTILKSEEMDETDTKHKV